MLGLQRCRGAHHVIVGWAVVGIDAPGVLGERPGGAVEDLVERLGAIEPPGAKDLVRDGGAALRRLDDPLLKVDEDGPDVL